MAIKKTRQILRLELLTIILVGLLLTQCAKPAEEKSRPDPDALNILHLDALYEEILMAGDTVGIVHVSSLAPDYRLAEYPEDGMASTYDASGAAVFYLHQYKANGDQHSLRKARHLLRFLLHMHAPSGYFYNYIWNDSRINAEGINSRAVPSAWSWRVLWAFGEALDILDPNDPIIYMISRYRNILINTVIHDGHFGSKATASVMGATLPTWLPQGASASEASVLLLGLSKALQQPSYSVNLDKADVEAHIRHFAEGIMMMQVHAPGMAEDGAFLSRDNSWQAAGNLQAYALLTSGAQLKDTLMIHAALHEIDTYYPSLIKTEMLHQWSWQKDAGKYASFDRKVFPQEVEGLRPAVWACLKAYQLNGERKYLDQAKALAGWLTGNNPAHQPMFDPATGLAFDGIKAEGEINKNSGALSTVESLLILQALKTTH